MSFRNEVKTDVTQVTQKTSIKNLFSGVENVPISTGDGGDIRIGTVNLGLNTLYRYMDSDFKEIILEETKEEYNKWLRKKIEYIGSSFYDHDIICLQGCPPYIERNFLKTITDSLVNPWTKEPFRKFYYSNQASFRFKENRLAKYILFDSEKYRIHSEKTNKLSDIISSQYINKVSFSDEIYVCVLTDIRTGKHISVINYHNLTLKNKSDIINLMELVEKSSLSIADTCILAGDFSENTHSPKPSQINHDKLIQDQYHSSSAIYRANQESSLQRINNKVHDREDYADYSYFKREAKANVIEHYAEVLPDDYCHDDLLYPEQSNLTVKSLKESLLDYMFNCDVKLQIKTLPYHDYGKTRIVIESEQESPILYYEYLIHIRKLPGINKSFVGNKRVYYFDRSNTDLAYVINPINSCYFDSFMMFIKQQRNAKELYSFVAVDEIQKIDAVIADSQREFKSNQNKIDILATSQADEKKTSMALKDQYEQIKKKLNELFLKLDRLKEKLLEDYKRDPKNKEIIEGYQGLSQEYKEYLSAQRLIKKHKEYNPFGDLKRMQKKINDEFNEMVISDPLYYEIKAQQKQANLNLNSVLKRMMYIQKSSHQKQVRLVQLRSKNESLAVKINSSLVKKHNLNEVKEKAFILPTSDFHWSLESMPKIKRPILERIKAHAEYLSGKKSELAKKKYTSLAKIYDELAALDLSDWSKVQKFRDSYIVPSYSNNINGSLSEHRHLKTIKKYFFSHVKTDSQLIMEEVDRFLQEGYNKVYASFEFR